MDRSTVAASPAVADSDGALPSATLRAAEKIDIEHVLVKNDPRKWSASRKNVILFLVSAASMIAGLGANIQNPSIADMEADLPATASQISLSISLFILLQGNAPLVWSAISEIKGRKAVYVVSLSIFTVGSIVVATSKTIALVIGFRCFQAIGSSAVLAIGAASLADIFDPLERGQKMGVYYVAPLLGPSLGPILGGALTAGFNWRATFWLLAIVSGTSCLSFLFFFNDTFRRERSLTYQAAQSKRSKEQTQKHSNSSSQVTIASATDPVPPPKECIPEKSDVEAQAPNDKGDTVTAVNELKLSLMDVNPIKPIFFILRRWNNVAILFASGLLFAFSFNITYTTSRTLGTAYHYNSLKIGLVLLSFGIGSIGGSILGGRWSDRVLIRLKNKNDGKIKPEMRLKSTMLGLVFFPPSVLGFAWVCEKRVHVAALCVMLFLCGFFSIWIYGSTLAYIVDANNGRSSTAVASNSSFRGLFAFISTEVAVPLQDSMGDGWLYTLWFFLMIASELLILLVLYRGGQWREAGEALEARKAEAQDS